MDWIERKARDHHAADAVHSRRVVGHLIAESPDANESWLNCRNWLKNKHKAPEADLRIDAFMAGGWLISFDR